MAHSPSVLIVDDEPDMLELLRAFTLESFPNVHVTGAASGEAALASLRATPADVVLSDYKMGGMNGIELLRRCRTAAPLTRRVLMTAFADSGLEEQARDEASVDAFLRKPLDPAQLVELLTRLLA